MCVRLRNIKFRRQRKIHDPFVSLCFILVKFKEPFDRPVVAGIQRAVAAGPLKGHLPRRVFFKDIGFRRVDKVSIFFQIIPLAVLFYLKEEISTVAAVDFRVRGIEDRHLDLSRIGGAIHHRHGDALMGVDLQIRCFFTDLGGRAAGGEGQQAQGKTKNGYFFHGGSSFPM